MKIPPARADRFLAAPPETLRAVLFYGPDGGLVRERAAALGKRHVGDLSDPFRVSAVAPAALGDEPGLLADEAAQLSLTGETRLVRLEAATEACAEPCRILLESEHAAALAIVEAGDPEFVGRDPQVAGLDHDPEQPLLLRIFLDRSVVEGLRRGPGAADQADLPAATDSIGTRFFARGGRASLPTLESWQLRPCRYSSLET